jgi:hypothetical protein
LLGEITPQRAAAEIAELTRLKKAYQATLRNELSELERHLEKTRDDISYYLNELARLNERPPTGGGLVLKGPQVTPPHDDVWGTGNSRSHFSNSATSAEIVYTLTSEGKLMNQIKTHFDYDMRFSGDSRVLRPGDTVTITITGRDTRTSLNAPGGGGWGVTGSVWNSGLQPDTEKQKPCSVGAGFNDGYHPTCTGEFEYKVPPGADKVVISVGGNFGIGVAATYTWVVAQFENIRDSLQTRGCGRGCHTCPYSGQAFGLY